MAVLHFTKENFDEVIHSSEPVLVDFWADWCGPCKALGPVIEEIASEANGFKVGKVDVTDQEDLAVEYNISSIPAVLVFKNGQVVDKNIGLTSKANLLAMVERNK